MPKPFHPLNDMVLMKAIPAVPEKIGRIYTPEIAREGKTLEAIVVATGPGKRGKHGGRIPTGLKPGDHVFVRWVFSGTIMVDGEEMFMLPAETEILGVREKK